MNERIRKLRKSLGLTQAEFGRRIGIQQTTVAGYETGGREPIDAVVTLICREFHVSETWLRTGDGEPFVKSEPDDELAYVFAQIKISDDDLIKKIIKTYWSLDEKEKAVIRKLIDGLQ